MVFKWIIASNSCHSNSRCFKPDSYNNQDITTVIFHNFILTFMVLFICCFDLATVVWKKKLLYACVFLRENENDFDNNHKGVRRSTIDPSSETQGQIVALFFFAPFFPLV